MKITTDPTRIDITREVFIDYDRSLDAPKVTAHRKDARVSTVRLIWAWRGGAWTLTTADVYAHHVLKNGTLGATPYRSDDRVWGYVERDRTFEPYLAALVVAHAPTTVVTVVEAPGV